MLTPEFLQDIADSLVNGVYRELQEDILKDIIRRILKADFSISDTAKWQAYKLQESGMLYKEILKEISKATNRSVDEVRQLFEEAAIENLYSVDNVDIEDPVEFLKASEGTMDILKAGWEKTNNTLLNFTLSTAESVQAAYFSAVDIAYLQVNSGAFDYNTAIYNAVKLVLESGAPIVTYPTGHRDQVDVAVRRAVMSGISNTATRVMLNLAEELELDYVDVSAHAGARPSHAEWQGKRYCISGKDKRFPHFETATKFGQGDGLGGWNCRHSVNPTTADAPPMYTAQELAELNNKKVTYDGEEMSLYDATQLQRKMEREMRKDRREVIALNEIKDQSDSAQARFSKVSQRIKDKERIYEDFCRQTGLATQKERLRVVGYNRSVSAKVRWAERKEYDKFRKTIALNGEGLPKTVAEYAEIKYNNKEEYELIQKYTKAVNKGELSPLSGFTLYKDTIRQVDERIVGMTTSNGIKITKASDHFIARIIGSVDERRSGVEIDDIIACLSSPDEIRDADRASGRGQKFVLKGVCFATVNPETGKLVQTNPRSEKK